jgi:hypothetical protein
MVSGGSHEGHDKSEMGRLKGHKTLADLLLQLLFCNGSEYALQKRNYKNVIYSNIESETILKIRSGLVSQTS